MAAVSAFATALVLATTLPPTRPVTVWRPLIEEASQRFGVPSRWIERVIAAESGGRTMLAGRPIRSRAGAIGLMQLMPGTWSDMRAALHLGRDPDDPHDNILAGTVYLRLMYDRFGYPGLFEAYNAGPARYAEHLVTGAPLPAETVAYLARVAPPRGAWPVPVGIFAIAPASRAPSPAPATLFIPLSDAPAADP